MPDTDVTIDETQNTGDTENTQTTEMSDADKHKILIMRHAYQKLDMMPLSFGLPQYDDDMEDALVSKYFSLDLKDALRESGIEMESIQYDSVDEMAIENRVVYYALKRFRLSSAVFFKFSTATDGKTVDKTNVPKMLKQIIDEYDAEYSKWKGKGSGSLWNRSSSLNYSNV